MLKNIISAFFSRGFVALSNFAILLLSAHYLGSEIVGQVSLLVLNIAVIQTVNEIYTGSALVYFIPKHTAGGIYRQGFLFALGCTLFLNLAFVLSGRIQAELALHLFLLSFIISVNSFHTVFLLAKEKIKAYNLLVFLQPLILLAVLATQIFIAQNRTFDAYIISLYISFGISLLLSVVFLLPVFRSDTGKEKVLFAAVLQNGFMNQLGNLAHTLSNRLNYYLLGSSALVGVYASSTSLIESVWIISGSVSPIILSHVANQKDAANNARLTLLLAKVCFALGIVCVLVLLFIPAQFFTFLLGPDFEQTKTVMLYLSPGVVCLSFSSIISHYFSGVGRQKTLLLANVSGLIITLCTAWPFIHAFGLLGACYAASCAYFVQAFVLTAVFVKQNKISFSEMLSLRPDISLLK